MKLITLKALFTKQAGLLRAVILQTLCFLTTALIGNTTYAELFTLNEK